MPKPPTLSSPSSRRRRGDRLSPALVLAAWLALLVATPGCDRGPTVEEARALHAQGRHADSLEPLRALIEERPDDPEVHYLYGVALGQTGSSRLAVWSLRKAAESPEWQLRATLALGAAALSAENWRDAIDAADEVLALDPENVPALVLRGEAYLGEGKEPERALDAFDQILEIEPDSVPARAARISALLMDERTDEASEALAELESTALERAPDVTTRARLCATRAVFDAERGETASAEERFDACLEQYPAQAVLIGPATSFFDQIGRPERSDEILAAALERAPESQGYRRTLSERAEAAGDAERAEAILREATASPNPELRAAAWTDLTNLYLGRHDLPAAIAAFEEALALSKNPSQLAILSHADMLARDGQHERALEVASRLDNDAYRGLIEARVHLNEGRPAEALARLDEVFPTWPNNAGARYYAARAAEQLGDFQRAIEEYRQSIRSAPDQTEAALRLARLYLAAGAYANAWNSASQYVRSHPEDPEAIRTLLRAAAPRDRSSLEALFTRLRPTAVWPDVVSARADSLAGRQGPEAALEWIESLTDLDLTQPANAMVLRSKVEILLALGRTAEARRSVDAALATGNETTTFHELRGRVLEAEAAGSSGAEAAPADTIRAAYARALELDPQSWRALEALGGRAEADGDVDAALELYDRAIEIAPDRPSPPERAAALAARSGRSAEAERRWEALLREQPWNTTAAIELATLQLARGQSDERTLELAERAVLFRGGDPARALLVRVHEARGEQERAQEIARAIERGERVPPRRISPIEGS